MSEHIIYTGRTHTGMRRESNQDHYFAAALGRTLIVESSSLEIEKQSRMFGDSLGYLFMVADGMGGHKAGNRASELAVHYVVGSILNSIRWVIRPDAASEDRFVSDLKAIMTGAHQAIIAEGKSVEEYHGMGTTLTVAYVTWSKMWVLHAGDSRCYLFRKGQLRQITKDHTIAEQMVAHGTLDAEKSQDSPWANVLWNALGAGASKVDAAIYKVDLEIGDRILLCSDGLNKHVDDMSIEKALGEHDSLDELCDRLISKANEAGGIDNITVVLADIKIPREIEMTTTVEAPNNSQQVFHRLTSLDPTTSDTTEIVERKAGADTEDYNLQ